MRHEEKERLAKGVLLFPAGNHRAPQDSVKVGAPISLSLSSLSLSFPFVRGLSKREANDRFKDAVLTLDFHHAAQHLWALAHARHGHGTAAARAWVEPLLHQLRHGEEQRVVQSLEPLLAQPEQRSVPSHKEVTREIEYLLSHKEHLHYQAREKEGAPMGSGAVESLCRQLQNRFKSCGQFWSRTGLTHLLAINVRFKNQSARFLWN
ncbi:MAG: hypothetical protein ACREF9_09080 [Opitutaceae bacterium]